MKRFILIIFVGLYSTYTLAQATDINSLPDSIQERLAFELAQIYALDQGIRDFHILKEYSEESKKIIPAIDSINFSKFIDFIKEYGYPTTALLGRYREHESVKTVGLVMLLHNPRRIVENPEIYLLFKNAVKEGRLSADIFAEALDKYYVFYKGKSLYNSQFKSYPKLAIKGVSIHDKELSDSLRMDIGLPPLSKDEFIYESQQP